MTNSTVPSKSIITRATKVSSSRMIRRHLSNIFNFVSSDRKYLKAIQKSSDCFQYCNMKPLSFPKSYSSEKSHVALELEQRENWRLKTKNWKVSRCKRTWTKRKMKQLTLYVTCVCVCHMNALKAFHTRCFRLLFPSALKGSKFFLTFICEYFRLSDRVRHSRNSISSKMYEM